MRLAKNISFQSDITKILRDHPLWQLSTLSIINLEVLISHREREEDNIIMFKPLKNS